MTSLNEVAQDVHKVFEHNDWVFEGYGAPVLEDVKVFLETTIEHLQDKPVGTVLSVNNMAIRKSPADYEVFIQIGRFNLEKDEE